MMRPFSDRLGRDRRGEAPSVRRQIEAGSGAAEYLVPNPCASHLRDARDDSTVTCITQDSAVSLQETPTSRGRPKLRPGRHDEPKWRHWRVKRGEMHRKRLADMPCPVARTLDLVGEWWTLL